MEEFLTVYNELLEPVGCEPRSVCHQKGLLHMVVYGWLLSRRPDGNYLWFQRRAFTKKDFPGLFDLAVGGHIDPGESADTAVLREMGEELGGFPDGRELKYLGKVREEFRMPGFFDREIAQVYLWEQPSPDFRPGEEVESMAAVRAEDYLRWELHQTETVPAEDVSGHPFLIAKDQWVGHSAEFIELIYPFLKQNGLIPADFQP